MQADDVLPARILVIDDEEADIQFQRRVLAPEDHRGLVPTTDPTNPVVGPSGREESAQERRYAREVPA